MTEEIGHNLPPFDPKNIVDIDILADQIRLAYAHLFAERDKLVVAAKKWIDSHPSGVNDDSEEADLTDRIAQALTVLDAYHGKSASAHTVAKEPFLKGGRIVDAVLNAELAGGLRDAVAPLQTALKGYKDAKVKRLREEQAAAIKKAAEEAAAQAAKLTRGSGNLETALEAEQASLDAIAEAENAKSSSLSMARGDLGTSSGLRGKWKARVVDIDKLPRRYMMPNPEMIALALAQSKDKKTGVPSLIIPGVQIYEETSLSVRR